MAVRFNWVRTGDGEPMTHIVVRHSLTREQVASLLITALKPHFYNELRELPKGKIEEAVRKQLTANPDAMFWWRDEYANEHPGGPTEDEVEAWAKRQVGKL